MTDDFTPWLTGVLDRIEQRANAAADCEPAEDDLDPAFSMWGRLGEFASRGGPVFEHVLLHSPVRVLPVVAAIRAVLAEHTPEQAGTRTVCAVCAEPPAYEATWLDHPCPTVRNLAAAFADQPGYRPEWRPQ